MKKGNKKGLQGKLLGLFLNTIGNVIPVMLGVYLGIFFNNKNEVAQKKEVQKKVTSHLLAENKLNLTKLGESLGYFEMLKDSVSLALDNKKSPSEFSFWKGMNPPELSLTSFQVAEIANTLPDEDLVYLVSYSIVKTSIESLHNQSNSYMQSITDRIGTPEFTNTHYKTVLFNYSFDQIGRIKNLIQELQEFNEILKSKK
ncbi:MAG: hypothetical protein AAGH46_00270 [Bacteroidota bacterium]